MTPTTDLDVTSDLGGMYLKRADVEGGPRPYTIASAARETFEARDGRPAQTRIVLTFGGDPMRKMGLNKTNLSTIATAWGKRASAWIGRTIIIHWDPTVMNRGSVVGGLRIQIQQLAPVVKTAADPRLEEQIRMLQAELQAAKAAQLPASTGPAAVVDDDIAFAFGANTGE